MSEWKEILLGEVIEVVNGFAFKSSEFLESKIDNSLPVIKIKNVANGDVHLNGCQFHKYSKNLDKFVAVTGDILLALTGNHPEVMTQVVGEASRFKLAEKAFLNQRVAKVLPKDAKVLNNDFLYYFLKDDNTHDYLASQSTGSANQANISKVDIENIPLNLPPLPEQTAIAEVLSSLDDKIDLLHRQNKSLEQLAETIFRQWFVLEAKEGWETKRISDVTSINSKTISKNYPYSEIEYLDTGSITEGKIEKLQCYQIKDAPSRAQRIVSENDIVYSVVRPIQKHYGLLHDLKVNTIVSTGFTVITCDKISPHFIYTLLTQNETVEYFDMVAEGSTSAYPSLKPSDIADFEFQLPPKEKLDAFHQLAGNNWCKIKSNNKQIRTLTELRDTLLTKLMSGEVRVKI